MQLKSTDVKVPSSSYHFDNSSSQKLYLTTNFLIFTSYLARICNPDNMQIYHTRLEKLG